MVLKYFVDVDALFVDSYQLRCDFLSAILLAVFSRRGSDTGMYDNFSKSSVGFFSQAARK